MLNADFFCFLRSHLTWYVLECTTGWGAVLQVIINYYSTTHPIILIEFPSHIQSFPWSFKNSFTQLKFSMSIHVALPLSNFHSPIHVFLANSKFPLLAQSFPHHFISFPWLLNLALNRWQTLLRFAITQTKLVFVLFFSPHRPRLYSTCANKKKISILILNYWIHVRFLTSWTSSTAK